MGPRERVACYIDGFNLYHAIDDLKSPRLKWVDLRKLCQVFVDRARQDLSTVYYFSAYATWIPESFKRHQEFIKALTATGVTVEMSSFYCKTRRCPLCKNSYKSHEEKQTDVKVALWMLDHAYQNQYDTAILVSGDSDMTPSVKLIRHRFPGKVIRVLARPNRHHSKELGNIVGQKNLKKILVSHVDKCLLPREVRDPRGNVVAVRPSEYDP
jgi:uncharacterized LabA/DUF88 family protein